ncbi:tRNA dihydrouridine(20/20a) synthase DusA [Flexibacterium corallicola]|uniref:tRNA dihydrouridine(20/20a) synthase DusA n=1 Tax=Flexibacterium corallicola TaxID=3037259 RepID=UPI00286EE1EF|nr:tRNA dihydrouridine(20/20a) synthase DusA [Pseudovibrio sp. M1P-2-3]
MENKQKLYEVGQPVFSVAPMLDWTDRHCRAFHRQFSRKALLYTEMITTGALLYGDAPRHLDFGKSEHPVACQLGGSDPKDLMKAARMVAEWGYDEINLNVGCPSDRVQNGRFGACLMLEPKLVGECIAAMKEVVDIPVTTKCRIGVDDQNEEEALAALVEEVLDAGTDAIWVHARKAWLKGLSPKENRDIPPLNYELVYALKKQNPDVFIGVNGGIKTLEECEQHLKHLDGVMVGRAAYQSPAMMAHVDERIYEACPNENSTAQSIREYIPYIEAELARGTRLSHITRHMLGSYQGVPGARHFRRILTVGANKAGAGLEVLEEALEAVERPASIGYGVEEQEDILATL